MNSERQSTLGMNEPLRCARDALSDLIEESPYMAYLKDVQTGKYILSNKRWADLLGLDSTDQLVGLTVSDFVKEGGVWDWDFGAGFESWKNKQPEEIKKLEEQVKISKSPVYYNQHLFTSEGLIFPNKLIKLPIFNHDNKKVIAVVTYDQNLILQYDLPELLKLYQKYYSTEEAIQYLLRYLDIDGYFAQLPDLKEMQLLFAIHRKVDLLDHMNDPQIQNLRNKVAQSCWEEMLTRLHAILENIH